MQKPMEGAYDPWKCQRLLSYVYFVADHDGYPPMPCKIHNQRQCNNFLQGNEAISLY